MPSATLLACEPVERTGTDCKPDNWVIVRHLEGPSIQISDTRDSGNRKKLVYDYKVPGPLIRGILIDVCCIEV